MRLFPPGIWFVRDLNMNDSFTYFLQAMYSILIVSYMQLYYLNELEGHDQYVDKSVCPTNWWTEKEMKHIFAWINDCGGFDKVIVS